MIYICPNKDCPYWGAGGYCNHGVPHKETEICFWENSTCPYCVEVKEVKDE
jgi:hypothetical protein